MSDHFQIHNMTREQLDENILNQLRLEYNAWMAVARAGEPVTKQRPYIQPHSMRVNLEMQGLFFDDEEIEVSLKRLVARGKAISDTYRQWDRTTDGIREWCTGFRDVVGYTYLNVLDELARAASA